MAALVKTGQYGDINTTDPSIMGYYGIKLMSEPYTLQEETNRDGKICTYGELFVKYQHMHCIKENMNWYWEQKS